MAKQTVKNLKEKALKEIDKKYIVYSEETFKENCFVKEQFEEAMREVENAKTGKVALAEQIIADFMRER